MDIHEGIKRMFQAGEFWHFEKEVLTLVKEHGSDRNIYYITLGSMFSGNAVADLLELMYDKPYFQTLHACRPDIAANPQLVGLTQKGEERLQELLTKE